MIFIDSNIPMYLVGAPHPNKAASLRLLEQCIIRNERMVTDVEVLQEILHRYAAINRRDAIQPAFDALLNIVDHVYAIDATDLERAKGLLLGHTQISARDAVHAAVMRRHGVERILSFDVGFSQLSWIERVDS